MNGPKLLAKGGKRVEDDAAVNVGDDDDQLVTGCNDADDTNYANGDAASNARAPSVPSRPPALRQPQLPSPLPHKLAQPSMGTGLPVVSQSESSTWP